MARRALALLLTTVAAHAGPAAVAQGTVAVRPPGELRVCGEGAVMDVFVDRGALHEQRRELPAGKCKNFALPPGKYAVTVTATCENGRDSRLTDITVAPAGRALYQGEALVGARVVRDSRTTFTATWACVGIDRAVPPGQPTPPPFGRPA